MLPREVVEELIGGLRATGFHVCATLANTFNGFLVVLTLPLEIVGQSIVERVRRIVPASAQDRASGANSSQLVRSRNPLKPLDLLGQMKMAERLIGVQQTAAFSLSATSPDRGTPRWGR